METMRKPLISPDSRKEGPKEDFAEVTFELDLGRSARFLKEAESREIKEAA